MAEHPTAKHPDVLVVGAGVIGLAIAWRCRQRGLSVTVLDPAPGSGASWTAAGMLAPVTELHFGEQPLLTLNLDSAARYPAFTAELEEYTGQPVGYRTCGTLAVAWDGADLKNLSDLQVLAQSLGRKTELVTGRQLREIAPALASGLPGGLVVADDHQVDNRLLHKALLAAALLCGVKLVARRAVTFDLQDDRLVGVTDDSAQPIRASTVVLAAGAWSSQIGGLLHAALPVLRPVKGQTLRLRLPGQPVLDRTLRGAVKGNSVYIVPRSDGQLVVGASSEECGFDLRPRAGAVYELLRDAQSLLPILSEAEFEEVSTSVRPGSPDNAPLIGATEVEGLILATGHYRNGILLTPVTADAIAELVMSATVPEVVASFAPSRFSQPKVPA